MPDELTNRNPLKEMTDELNKENGNPIDFKIQDIRMPDVEVSINKMGVEGRVSPVSDKPQKRDNPEWYKG